MMKFARNKDNIAKLTALITAIVLWFVVMNEQNPPADVTYQVPLHIRNVQADHFVSQNDEKVDVTVRGPRSVVASAAVDEFYAYLDMAQLDTGTHKVKVHAVVPSSLEIVAITPDKCSVTLDKMVRQNRKVELAYSGLATEGVRVDAVKTEVEEVVLDGPSLLLDKVTTVVAHVDLAGKEQDFSEEAVIKALDSEGKEVTGITIAPDKTAIQGKVISVPVSKTVKVSFQTVGNLPSDLELKDVEMNRNEVAVSGYRPNVEAVDSLKTEPLNLSNITGSTTVELKIVFPEGITSDVQTIAVTLDVAKKGR